MRMADKGGKLCALWIQVHRVHEEQRRKAQIRKVFANARAIVTPLASLCPDEYPFWLLRLRKRVAVELGTAKV